MADVFASVLIRAPRAAEIGVRTYDDGAGDIWLTVARDGGDVSLCVRPDDDQAAAAEAMDAIAEAAAGVGSILRGRATGQAEGQGPVTTDRDPMLDVQRAAGLALADLLARDLPVANWSLYDVDVELTGQISAWRGTRDERIAMIRRWADTFGAEPVVQHARKVSEHLEVVFKHQGVKVRVWTLVAASAEGEVARG